MSMGCVFVSQLPGSSRLDHAIRIDVADKGSGIADYRKAKGERNNSPSVNGSAEGAALTDPAPACAA